MHSHFLLFCTQCIFTDTLQTLKGCIVGTTMKGAIDDLDLVIQTLEESGFSRDRFYIHCDGALFGIMLPFVKRVSYS